MDIGWIMAAGIMVLGILLLSGAMGMLQPSTTQQVKGRAITDEFSSYSCLRPRK